MLLFGVIPEDSQKTVSASVTAVIPVVFPWAQRHLLTCYWLAGEGKRVEYEGRGEQEEGKKEDKKQGQEDEQ